MSTTELAPRLLILFEQLYTICESDEISLTLLREEINLLRPQNNINNDFHENYEFAPFFHAACMNKYITLEVIQYLLDEFPQVVEVTDEYEGTHTRFIHVATMNIVQVM